MPKLGQFGPTGPRPHIWKSGPDESTHARYVAWGRARAQANFRGETWEIDWPDWELFWQDRWHLRGRRRDGYMMTRIDPLEPWNLDNVQLMQRSLFGAWQREQHRIKTQ